MNAVMAELMRSNTKQGHACSACRCADAAQATDERPSRATNQDPGAVAGKRQATSKDQGGAGPRAGNTEHGIPGTCWAAGAAQGAPNGQWPVASAECPGGKGPPTKSVSGSGTPRGGWWVRGQEVKQHYKLQVLHVVRCCTSVYTSWAPWATVGKKRKK
jgi:hypothetical protein